MLNDELQMLNKEPVTYSILNKEPGISSQLHIAARFGSLLGKQILEREIVPASPGE